MRVQHEPNLLEPQDENVPMTRSMNRIKSNRTIDLGSTGELIPWDIVLSSTRSNAEWVCIHMGTYIQNVPFSLKSIQTKKYGK